MKLGFTGTQVGMTDKQKSDLRAALIDLNPTQFHHGDCVGADEQAHKIATLLDIKVVIHPPKNASKRAFCSAYSILPEKEYLDRNRDIVDSTDMLIACPKGPEQLRSGTWSTIRHAKRTLKPVQVLRP